MQPSIAQRSARTWSPLLAAVIHSLVAFPASGVWCHCAYSEEAGEIPRDIVIAADAGPAVRHAAEEFERFFAEASGRKLAIVEAVDGPTGHVFIGPGAAFDRSPLAFPKAELGEEDLRYVVRGGNMAIVGGAARGTLYGVYTFLEDVLGVRFLTADHTHVPRLEPRVLQRARERTFRPPFRYRAALYGANYGSAFGVRLRNNAFNPDPRYGGINTVGLVQHTLHHWVPSNKLGREHPEYFAEIGGKRRWDVGGRDDTQSGTQPCLTNPDVRRLIVEGAVTEARAHPDRMLISVAQNDNNFYCRCRRCEAVYDREDATIGTLLEVVNAAADAVTKVRPGALVGTYAYQFTRRPPKRLRPRPNVLIQFAPIEACQMHAIEDPTCPIGKPIAEDLAGWRKLTDHLYGWNYFTIFPDYMLPCPNLRTIEPNIRLFARSGMKGLFMQGTGGTKAADLEDLRNYVISGLLWDPDRAGDELIDEFLRLHYGAAYPAMRQYVDMIHDPIRLNGLHYDPYGEPADYGITPELAKRSIALMENALRLADNDAERRRVRKASIAAYRAAIAPAVIEVRTKNGKLSRAEAESMRPAAERFFALCGEFDVHAVGEGRSWAAERDKLRALFAAAGAPLADGE